MRTTHRATVNLHDIPAAIAAARERSGRDLGDIIADYAHVAFHRQDVIARATQIEKDAKTEGDRVMAKIAALNVVADPTVIKRAGVALRRVDPVAEMNALIEARKARNEQDLGNLKALAAYAARVDELIEAMLGEFARAGVPRDKVQALLDMAEHRVVS